MKIAAIDVGSNSLHMVIAEADRNGGFVLLDGEKDMVRLGAGTLSSGRLSATAMRNALEVLRDYKRLADSRSVDKILGVATSAIREARNGEDLLDRIARQFGVYVRPISGEQEARFVYLAAQHSIHLEGKRALVLDIGGGSVELAAGSGPRVDYGTSEKIGVLRMMERFASSDPLSSADERRLVNHLARAIKPHRERIVPLGIEQAVGTSGTILALGALAHHEATGKKPEVLHHLTVGADAIHALRKRLVRMPIESRLRIRGLDPTRADIVAVGAVILDTLLSRLGVRELTLSEWALREGVLLDYIRSHPRSLARAEDHPDVRRRSVLELAERCQTDRKHADHVANLALRIFDLTGPLHGLGEREWILLEHAAFLHDVGHHISHPRHHRHSYYLIKNGELRGFRPEEIEIMASVARYHRRGLPKKKNAVLSSLPPPARRTVRVLAGILRVADSLDRGHRQSVREIEIARRRGVLFLKCSGEEDMELEIWGARRRIDLLQRALGLEIRLSERVPRRSGRRQIRRARAG
jgi:exopolyphosphatase/guanosine-5'-triphosphate,3'-diphosphate pyrophosphatase